MEERRFDRRDDPPTPNPAPSFEGLDEVRRKAERMSQAMDKATSSALSKTQNIARFLSSSRQSGGE